MYDNNHIEREENGWIALGVLAFIIVCGFLVLWEPDVEAIGNWMYTYFFSAH